MTAPDVEAPGPSGDGTGRGGKDSAQIIAAGDAERKALATIKARAALLGLTLHALPGGGVLVCRSSWTRECASLDAVAAMLDRMERAR